MTQFLTYEDVVPFSDELSETKANAMIKMLEALTLAEVPELAEVAADSPQHGAVKAILLNALLRWADAGTGALSQHTQTAGPFSENRSFDTRQSRGPVLWPSEIAKLKGLVERRTGRQAGSFDTAPGSGCGGHSDMCDVFFGDATCSCLTTLNRHEAPLYETGGLLTPGSL